MGSFVQWKPNTRCRKTGIQIEVEALNMILGFSPYASWIYWDMIIRLLLPMSVWEGSPIRSPMK
jgi:hypothetical protein